MEQKSKAVNKRRADGKTVNGGKSLSVVFILVFKITKSG